MNEYTVKSITENPRYLLGTLLHSGSKTSLFHDSDTTGFDMAQPSLYSTPVKYGKGGEDTHSFHTIQYSICLLLSNVMSSFKGQTALAV